MRARLGDGRDELLGRSLDTGDQCELVRAAEDDVDAGCQVA